MSAAASGTLLGWREQTTARRGGMGSDVVDVRIGRGTPPLAGGTRTRSRGKAVQRRAGPAPVRQTPIARAALAHRVSQRDQVVLVGIGGKRAGVAHEFPAPGCGDPAGMADAQIP